MAKSLPPSAAHAWDEVNKCWVKVKVSEDGSLSTKTG